MADLQEKQKKDQGAGQEQKRDSGNPDYSVIKAPAVPSTIDKINQAIGADKGLGKI